MCELCEAGEARWMACPVSKAPAVAVSPYRSGGASPVAAIGDATVDSLLAGSKWGKAPGSGADIEFSFAGYASRWSADYGEDEPDRGFRPFNAQQEAAARKALQLWADIADLDFAEVRETASQVGDIRFGLSSAPSTAWAYYPDNQYPEGGDVWLGTAYHRGRSDYGDGTYAFHTVLHEIGHALGLKHPHDRDGPGVTSGADWQGVTVMSYRSYPGDAILGSYSNDFFPTSPMLWDVAAIQALYGANHATRAGDTAYRWGNGEQIFECIWDGGGRDVIDCSNQSAPVVVSLVAGSWSQIGPAYSWSDGKSGSVADTLAIAHGVTIEDARGGRGNDKLVGNGVGNRLDGGAGSDRLYGGGGTDVLDGGPGVDRLIGGSGGDRFLFDDGDSGIGSLRDRILDFDASAGDRIDLRQIDAHSGIAGDQAFVWKAAATLGGAAQLGFYRSGGNTIIRGSTDGDAAAEFEIQLNGSLTPIAEWFLL